MLKAYFDESGIHRDAQACIVAGFVGKGTDWRKQDRGWRKILRRFEVPLEEFHAKDAVKKAGYFVDWDRDKWKSFMSNIAKSVMVSRVCPVCSGIFIDEFMSLSLPERRFLTGATWNAEEKRFISTGCPSKAYFVCFTECLKNTAEFGTVVDRILLFFGCDDSMAKYARYYWRYLQARMKQRRALGLVESRSSPERFGSVTFPLAKDTPALQAADLFSYLSYEHMLERRMSGNWNKPPSGPLLTLLTHRKSPIHTSFRSAKLLRKMIRVVPDLPTS